jgi:hypothetical protein
VSGCQLLCLSPLFVRQLVSLCLLINSRTISLVSFLLPRSTLSKKNYWILGMAVTPWLLKQSGAAAAGLTLAPPPPPPSAAASVSASGLGVDDDARFCFTNTYPLPSRNNGGGDGGGGSGGGGGGGSGGGRRHALRDPSDSRSGGGGNRNARDDKDDNDVDGDDDDEKPNDADYRLVSHSFGFATDGTVWLNGEKHRYTPPLFDAAVVGVAVDMLVGTVELFVDGVGRGVAFGSNSVIFAGDAAECARQAKVIRSGHLLPACSLRGPVRSKQLRDPRRRLHAHNEKVDDNATNGAAGVNNNGGVGGGGDPLVGYVRPSVSINCGAFAFGRQRSECSCDVHLCFFLSCSLRGACYLVTFFRVLCTLRTQFSR